MGPDWFIRGIPGIEPGTSRTLSENHAARPNPQVLLPKVRFSGTYRKNKIITHCKFKSNTVNTNYPQKISTDCLLHRFCITMARTTALSSRNAEPSSRHISLTWIAAGTALLLPQSCACQALSIVDTLPWHTVNFNEVRRRWCGYPLMLYYSTRSTVPPQTAGIVVVDFRTR